LAHAIDTCGFIQNTLHGNAVRKTIPALNSFIAYPDHLDFKRFDLDYARALMAEAGHSEGFDMQVHVLDGTFTLLFSEFIKESLKSININVNIVVFRSIDWNYIREERQTSAFLLGTPPPVLNNAFEVFGQLFTYYPDVLLRNFLRNYHPEKNRLLFELGQRYVYTERVLEIYRELVEIIHYEIFVLPFFVPKDFIVLNNRFNFIGDNLLTPYFNDFQYISRRNRR
jgi:ABC-type transport system substrate-binding protein